MKENPNKLPFNLPLYLGGYLGTGVFEIGRVALRLNMHPVLGSNPVSDVFFFHMGDFQGAYLINSFTEFGITCIPWVRNHTTSLQRKIFSAAVTLSAVVLNETFQIGNATADLADIPAGVVGVIASAGIGLLSNFPSPRNSLMKKG